MNEVKIQFKALIFKYCILLLTLVFLNLSSSSAQTLVDTNYVKKLYANAKVLYTSGDFDNAIRNLNEVLLLKNKMPNDINPKYFKVYNRFGIVYRKQGNLQNAIDYYRYALEHTKDGYNITFINDNIAIIYSLMGDYTKAIYYLENSLAVLENCDKESKYLDIYDNYHNQGFAYLNSDQMELALEKSLIGIQIAEENQISVGWLTYNNCGLIYQYLDSLDKSIYYFKKAIEYNEKEYGKNHYKTALAYMYCGVSFSKLGNYKTGLELYQKSLKTLQNKLGYKHPFTSYCLKHIGNLYYQTKKYKLALRYYQKSLISKNNSFNDSSIYSNPSENVFPDLDLLDVLKAKAQSLELLATQECEESNLKAALSTLELAVGFVEQLRMGYLYEPSKLKLADKEHETYLSIISIANSLYEISGDTKYADIAFKYAEQSRYAILRELKNEETIRGITGVPDSISGKERKVKEQISIIRMQKEEENKTEIPVKIEELNRKIYGLTQELEDLMQELERNYPKYYKQKYRNKVVSLTQLQKALDKKEAVLEFVLTDSTLYTFTITKDTFTLLKQNAGSIFHSSLDFYRTALHREHSSNYYEYRNAAYNLYKKLIYPVEPLLKNKNLLIIPDNQMNFISFDVLIDKPYKSTDRPDYRTESYLLRKYPISYAYSATLYAKSLSGKSNASPKFLGIAPSYENSKDSLQHMPLGLKSARNIAFLTLGKSLTGNKVTESKFRKYSKNYDIIHFYAHGFEDTLNPANSKLYLSPPKDTTSDAYLYAWEVYNMQLNARLVVLASCYSGAGKFSKGEGVMSIGRSFINAGSETVIMSLWEASYKPTITILNYFYWNLLKGMQKDEALRLAKLKYLEKTDSFSANPRFWAGIIIIGNQLALYKAWYIKKIITLLVLSGLLFLFIKKRKSFFKLKN